uniref:HNH nuclease domain-containing protein n=1 Tax=viral metagenome TaxID=1070528 RepID=A0A6C0HBV4_9ZZZZ
MKLELFILGVTAFLIYNAYHDGKYTKMFFSYKKYFQMGFLALLGISLYLLIKRDPLQTKKILFHANNVVKYMPIDKSSMDMLSPIVDFTSGAGAGGFMNNMNQATVPQETNFERRIMQSGGKATKRSVSETKKKYVASKQNWICGKCNKQLNHTFEIDHKIRLEYGGTNEVDNLIALCRNCHGEKTAMENM